MLSGNRRDRHHSTCHQMDLPDTYPGGNSWAVARAFYIASTGRPGSCRARRDTRRAGGHNGMELRKITYIRSYNPDPELQPGNMLSAASLLNRAERPMVIAGHGVMLSNAEADIIALAEKADIPVVSTLLGLSSVPSDHPLYKGMVGMHGNIGP